MYTHISVRTCFPQRESSCCLSCCSHSIPHNLSREGMWPCLSSVLPVTTLLKADPEVTETQHGLKDLERERTRGTGLAPRVGLRMPGDKDPKRTAGGASGTQTPALQLHALGRPAVFPQLGLLQLLKVTAQPCLCSQHLLDVMRAKLRPSCHLVRWAEPGTQGLETRALVSALLLTSE